MPVRVLPESFCRASLAAVLALGLTACSTAEDDRPAASGSAASPQPATEISSKREAEKAAATEKSDYLPKVVLSNVTARKIVDPQDRIMALVSGVLKNTGDRSVSDVEVTINFLDRAGETSLETTYHPVSPALRNEGPLKPNSSRKWNTAILVFEDWAGKINARVSRLEFAEP